MTPFPADAGVPMLFWQMPVAAVALLPIVLIESLTAWPILKQSPGRVWFHIMLANLFSTFVGVPIAWVGMLIVEMVTSGSGVRGFDTPLAAFQSIVMQAAWLIPYEDKLVWLIPAATLVLLLPYFFVSVYAERWVLRRLSPAVERRRIVRASWLTNLASYGALAAYTAFWLMRSLQAGATTR